MRLRLKISKDSSGYLCDFLRVESDIPFVAERMLTTVRCMGREELFELLIKLEFHERDILDAFDETDGALVDDPEFRKLLNEVDKALEHPEKPWHPSVDISKFKPR